MKPNELDGNPRTGVPVIEKIIEIIEMSCVKS